VGSPVAGAAEAYTLRVEQHGVWIWGAEPAGVARGVQTLRQLLAQARPNLPALRIEDAPALPWRGVMLDVSRGKVPTLQTLMGLVDALASYKLNMLQLYVEHTFAFRRHPKIGGGWGALTPEEITALDAYCRERYVELIPCLQSFGHLRRILELPEYAHLAESAQRWSLAPTLEETYAFLDDLYADFLACFSSRYFNVGSDETYDLGTGRSKEVAEREGLGRLYLEHIKRLHGLATRYGRTMMVWDDIFLHYPELTSEIPGDAILLNWEYEAADDYPQVNGFHQAGLRQVVCPGTSSWNTLFPRLTNARDNIRNFVGAGLRVGALGMLNTDWGDGGHYNMLGASWYPYAYGAAEAWGPQRLETDAFERRFAALTFGHEADAALAAIRLLSEACTLPTVLRRNGSRTIDLFFGDPLAEDAGASLPGDEELARMDAAERDALLMRRAGCTRIPDETMERMHALAREASALLAPLVGADEEAARTLAEFRLAAREIAHAARKGQLARRLPRAGDQETRDALGQELDALKRELHALRAEHERLWLARSKPGGIWLSLDRFDRSATLIDGWRARIAAAYSWDA
jgi:hypothetical protein